MDPEFTFLEFLCTLTFKNLPDLPKKCFCEGQSDSEQTFFVFVKIKI